MNVPPSSPLVHVAFALLVLAALVTDRWLLVSIRSRRAVWIGYGILGLVAVLFLWNVSEPPEELFKDFKKAYYWAGRFVLMDPQRLYHGDAHFTNLPILAFLFIPFTYLPEIPAALVLTVLGVAVLFASGSLLSRMAGLTGRERIALVGLFLFNGPLYYSVREGNLTHFVLLLLIASLTCRSASRDYSAGVLLGLSAVLKPPLVLLTGYYFLRREWRVFAASVLICTLTLVASLALFGFDLHHRWFDECVRPFLAGPVIAFNAQSIDAALARLAVPGHLRDWKPVEVGLGLRAARYAIVALIWLAFLSTWARSRSKLDAATERTDFSIVLMIALTTSPLSWSHYYLLCLIPASLALGHGLPELAPVWPHRLLFLGMFCVSLPVIYVEAHTLVGRLLLSHTLIGGLFLLAALLGYRREGKPGAGACG